MTLRSQSIHPAGTWNQAQATDEVLIDYDRRHRRRIMLKTESGAEILLDLPQAARLRDGDGRALDTGAIIRVRARPEPLAEFHAHSDAELVRIAGTSATATSRSSSATTASAATTSSKPTLDDRGTAIWRADLPTMRHETQYTRLFRS